MNYTEEEVDIKLENSIITVETFIYGIAYKREDWASWVSYAVNSTTFLSYEDFKDQQLKSLNLHGTGKQFKIKWFKFKVE